MKICISCGRNNNKYPSMVFDGNTCVECAHNLPVFNQFKIHDPQLPLNTKLTERYCSYCQQTHKLNMFYISTQIVGGNPYNKFYCKKRRADLNKKRIKAV